MPADLDDLCDRTEKLEEAITGPDGIRVQLARHFAQDEGFQQEARAAWNDIKAEQKRAREEAPKPWGARELGIVATIVTTVATIVGGLAGMGGSSLPTAQAGTVHVIEQAQHAPGPTVQPADPQE